MTDNCIAVMKSLMKTYFRTRCVVSLEQMPVLCEAGRRSERGARNGETTTPVSCIEWESEQRHASVGESACTYSPFIKDL